MSKKSSAVGASQAEAPEGRPVARAAAESRGKASARVEKGTTAPWNEEALNAPSRQTVGMLAILAVATLIFWAAGRAACNYHEPGESLSPRQVPLETRTRTDKDVAMELSLSWSGADFEVARQLVAGELAQAVEKDEKSCQGAACEARRAARESIHSVPEVLRRSGRNAFVRVRTVGAPGGEVIRVFELERIDGKWKATRQLGPDEPLPPVQPPPSSPPPETAEAPAP